jgi:hypothetical protein
MKWLRSWLAASAIAATLAGCASGGTPRGSFDAWRRAIVRGDFRAVFEHMSPTFRSHWVFLIFTPDQATGDHTDIAKDAYRALDQRHLKEFDAWLEHAKNAYPATRRVPELPDTILSQRWTYELLERYFRLVHPHIKVEFAAMEVPEGPEPEENLITLIVKNIRGASELYELILHEGQWRVHYHRAGPGN